MSEEVQLTIANRIPCLSGDKAVGYKADDQAFQYVLEHRIVRERSGRGPTLGHAPIVAYHHDSSRLTPEKDETGSVWHKREK